MSRALALCAGLAVTSVATAGTSVFSLSDHDYGNQNPPPYGLRFDGLFGGNAVTTFSFDYFADTLLTVVGDSSGITITIEGTVYGGEVDGMGGYAPGAAAYDLEMTYSVGVTVGPDGYTVTTADSANMGTLTLQSDSSVSYDLFDFSEPSFQFLRDGHRIPGDTDTWVGRGWLEGHDDASSSPLTRDFLFVGDLVSGPPIIPLPLSGSMGLAGLTILAARRRR